MTTQRYERIPVFTPGDRLRKAREMADLDQGQLAEATGISRGTVSHLELGKAPLKRSYLHLWAMVTGVPVQWLETGDGPSATPPPGTDDDEPMSKLDRLTESKRERTRRRGEPPTHRYVAQAA